VDESGNYIRPPAICYVPDWYVGFAVLNSYKAGTYKPGDEVMLARSLDASDATELEDLTERILRDYGQWHMTPEQKAETEEEKRRKMTFAQVYEEFYEWKFGESAPKKLSDSRKRSVVAAYKNLSPLHGRVFRELRVDDLQAAINGCQLARGSLEKMKGLLSEIYSYADARELCERDYARHVVIPSGAREDEHGVPFSEADLRALWADRDDEMSGMLIIMCYSGFRISAYRTLEVSLEGGYFKGGIKTEAGKGRTVPIHPCISGLVAQRMERDGSMLTMSDYIFRKRMAGTLERLKIKEHTPHDCRHTFSALCERYGVSGPDRKRMMGHSFGNDITNGIYGHRSLEDLAKEVRKIPSPPDLTG
jgi:integrase